MLVAMLWLLASSIVVIAILRRQNRLSRPALVGFVGLDIAFVAGILTPGIAWGDFDSDSALRPISTLVFYLGVGVMIWAAVLWRRPRSQPRPESN